MVVSSENGLEFSGFVDELSSTVIACDELDLFGYNPTSVGASFSYDSSGPAGPSSQKFWAHQIQRGSSGLTWSSWRYSWDGRWRFVPKSRTRPCNQFAI
jgi:hypothetical protein